jgi:hypothetical protein
MKSVSGKEFAKVLERHGWSLLRIQGSHQIYGKTVPTSGCPSLFTATKRSKSAYSGI